MVDSDPLKEKIRIYDNRDNQDSNLAEQILCTLDKFLSDPLKRDHIQRTIDAYGSINIVLLDSSNGSAGSKYNTIYLAEKDLATEYYQAMGGGFENMSLEQSLAHELGHTGDVKLIQIYRNILIAGYDRLAEEKQSTDFPKDRDDESKVRIAIDVFYNQPVNSPDGKLLRQGMGAAYKDNEPRYTLEQRELYAISAMENPLLEQTGKPLRDISRYAEHLERDNTFHPSAQLDHLPGFEDCETGQSSEAGDVTIIRKPKPAPPAERPPRAAPTEPPPPWTEIKPRPAPPGAIPENDCGLGFNNFSDEEYKKACDSIKKNMDGIPQSRLPLQGMPMANLNSTKKSGTEIT